MAHATRSQRAAHISLLIWFMFEGYFKGTVAPDLKFRCSVLCKVLYYDPTL